MLFEFKQMLCIFRDNVECYTECEYEKCIYYPFKKEQSIPVDNKQLSIFDEDHNEEKR